MLLTIFSFNILSNPFNCPSTRGSLLSIAFLQSYKKAVDEVSDIFSLHLSLSIFVLFTFKHSFAACLIYFCHSPSQVFNRSLINISHHLSFLNSPPIFLSVSFTASDAVSVTIISCTFLHRTNLSQSFTVSVILDTISEFSLLPRQQLF